MCGEWSQADTDCAPYLNNVGVGARWTGNFDNGDPALAVSEPVCPQSPSSKAGGGEQCDCTSANAPPSRYSDSYRQYLLTLASAQMDAFEQAWGWFYWTWDTEDAVH